MINIHIKYLDDLFEDEDGISFWTWKQFVDHMNRLYRWKIPFELTSIHGYDISTKNRWEHVCLMLTPPEEDNTLVELLLGRNEPWFTSKQVFLSALNERSRR